MRHQIAAWFFLFFAVLHSVCAERSSTESGISLALLNDTSAAKVRMVSLKNNTKWALLLYGTSSKSERVENELTDGTKVQFIKDQAQTVLCIDLRARPRAGRVITRYSKKEQPVRVPTVPAWQNCWNTGPEKRAYGGIWLKPGGVVRFEVPENYVNEDLFIGTEISYEWESENGLVPVDAPRHFVYLDPFNWFKQKKSIN
jgi:hypothetical protein